MAFVEFLMMDDEKIFFNTEHITIAFPYKFGNGEKAINGTRLRALGMEYEWNVKEDYETVKQKIKRGDITLPPGTDVFTERVRKGLIP